MGRVNRNRSDEPDLIYTDGDSGRARASKRTQVLCFVHAGDDADDSLSLFNETGVHE